MADPAWSAPGSVRLAEPDARWPDLFERERQLLASIPNGAFRTIAHFGSTAVAGLRAKPVIDIMASVEALAAVDAMRPSLRGLGYEQAEVGFERRCFLRKPETSDGVAYHLHIIIDAALPNKNELLVRDWLTSHPDVAACYAKLKTRLAQKHAGNMAAYTVAKSAFLRGVVNDARRHIGLPQQTDWAE